MRGGRVSGHGPARPHPRGAPRYLLRRKEEWSKREEEERRARERTEGCPAGMVVMPEEERLDTLRALEKNILAPQAAARPSSPARRPAEGRSNGTSPSYAAIRFP